MIKVLNPGFYSSIQDFGRLGYQEYGVPYSGVMDKKAASIVNALLGNHKNEAVLEMTMTGAKLQFNIQTYIAISGADMSPTLNGLPVHLNKIIAIKPNDILAFARLQTGFRCYLAILGGFKTETVMNSKSMRQNITQKVKLHKNDDLQVVEVSIETKNKHASVRFDTSYITANTIEVFKGPEFDKLSEAQQLQLFSNKFTISKDNNRMAYQLEETIDNNLKPIITSPVLPGTVQLTPSGKLIVLMCDCQTTGGYPRVLQLKESAINVLAQKFMGSKIKFSLYEI
ncbi:MAG: biotin-dependent carboxyltransferase family protein [Tamlana sp.]